MNTLETGLLLGGRSTEAESRRTFDRPSPIAPGTATRAAAASPADAIRMVEAAAAAFPAWSETGPNHRRELLNKAAQLLVARSDDFVRAMVAETGCAESWARFNCRLGAEMLIEAGAMTTRILGETIPADRPGTLAMAVRQAAGVSLGIAPWNAPVVLGVRAVAMPLACGNTAILKASELSPATHVLIGEVLQEAGLPQGVINVLTNAAEDSGPVVEAMIAHPAVRRVNFTGSTRVGRLIGEMCGRYLKPCVLELGGKAPLVVLADADVHEAARATAFGAFMHQGQICMSTEKAVVLEPVAEAFVASLAERARSIRAANPAREKAPLGALVAPAAAARIRDLIDDAVRKGARLAAGGGIDGVVVQCTVLADVTPAMRIYREESFGPVVAVVRARTVDEAVEFANDTEYGLAASVFGRDVSEVIKVAKRIRSGSCHINGPTVYDEAQMPFGGLKDSGVGRFGGQSGVEAFTDLRWITIQITPPRYPI